ncbi:hypothetical protein HDU86_004756 [Geranomyces michiganensis]|nr:hypothetical protein HDU86_004756 [Geranomyces michiganensis]
MNARPKSAASISVTTQADAPASVTTQADAPASVTTQANAAAPVTIQAAASVLSKDRDPQPGSSKSFSGADSNTWSEAASDDCDTPVTRPWWEKGKGRICLSPSPADWDQAYNHDLHQVDPHQPFNFDNQPIDHEGHHVNFPQSIDLHQTTNEPDNLHPLMTPNLDLDLSEMYPDELAMIDSQEIEQDECKFADTAQYGRLAEQPHDDEIDTAPNLDDDQVILIEDFEYKLSSGGVPDSGYIPSNDKRRITTEWIKHYTGWTFELARNFHSTFREMHSIQDAVDLIKAHNLVVPGRLTRRIANTQRKITEFFRNPTAARVSLLFLMSVLTFK